MPGVDTARLTHQQLLRSMDALMDHQDAVDDCVASLLRPLIDDDLSVVFYDLTTIRTEGLSELQGDIRRHGMSKQGLIARQFMLGVVQTADGMPIYHEVFAGNTSEAPTLQPTLKKVLARYPHVRRLIVVADRGLLSLDNIEELGKLRLTGDQPLEFILAVPGRRYSEFEEILASFQVKAGQAEAEIIDEAKWQSLRLVVAHNPERAREQTDLRRQRIAALQARADELAGKLDAQDAGQVKRGRKLSDSGAKARFFHEVADARLSRIFKVDLKSDLFTYDIDPQAQQRAELMDGKLLLVTNVLDLTPQEIVRRYKALADIERGFRVLKSEIEIAPVFHRLPERIKAHASLCFMALIVYRVMRQRLKLAKSELSPEAALGKLRRIQRHSVSINAGATVAGVSTINQEQAKVFEALKLTKPTHDTQLSLL
jgi:transposase